MKYVEHFEVRMEYELVMHDKATEAVWIVEG